MGRSGPKLEKKHMGICSSFLAGILGAFAAAVALIELIQAATITEYSIFGTTYGQVGYTSKFQQCDNGQGINSNPCISMLTNVRFALCVYAAFTFVFALTTILIPFRSCLPSFLNVIDPLFDQAPGPFFIVLGFLTFGMSGILGFACGIACWVLGVLFIILCVV